VSIITTQITIAGVDYTPYCDLETIEVDNNVVMTHDTFTFTVRLRGELPRPKRGNEVIWTNNGNREFGGIVTEVSETDIGGDLEYVVSAHSYEPWFNRRLVVNYYSSATADSLVKQIVQQFCPGFTTANVLPGYTLPPQYFNYVTPSDAIKKLAEQIEYGWYIDYYKDVHFYPIESFTSPLPSNTLNADTDTVNYSDLVLKEDGTQLKTRIYLKGFKSRVGTPITLTFIGDGYTTQWSLGYKPSRNAGDVTVTVGGVPKTVKRDLVDGSPGQNTSDQTSAYINYSQNLLRLNYAPASGVQIVVTMYYLQDTIVMREDPQAQSAAAAADGSGNGIYEFAVTEPSLTQATIAAANARGDMLLYKYGYPQITGTFVSFTQGWRAGQYFYLISNRRMGGINQKMYVHQVKKRIVRSDSGGAFIRYEIAIADIPYLVQ
jgi:hypothetical protein